MGCAVLLGRVGAERTAVVTACLGAKASQHDDVNSSTLSNENVGMGWANRSRGRLLASAMESILELRVSAWVESEGAGVK
jgi:hypothetical protein